MIFVFYQVQRFVKNEKGLLHFFIVLYIFLYFFTKYRMLLNPVLLNKHALIVKNQL